jgi:hypothetical protein
VNGYRLPPVPPCEIPGCVECADLAAALDADVAARLRVLVAAEAADRRHRLNARVLARPASGDRTPQEGTATP